MVEGEIPALPGKETENSTQRWGYDTRFIHYLYRISVLGNKGVEIITNFPARIELNDKWHQALHQMRTESRDGIERWVPVGMNENKAPDFVPRNFVKGGYAHAKVLTKKEIKEQYGIVHNAGEIHSHPTDWFNRLGINLIVATRLVKDFEGFSTEDLYNMVRGKGLPMYSLAEKSYNYFAFRTTETQDLQPDSPLQSEMAFSRHWARKYGGRFLGNNYLSFWAPPTFSVRKLNIDVAEAYNLALYKGKPGEDLVREFPRG